MILKAPFPWFGGKSRVAHVVWKYMGNIRNYVEPFFGSGAVLLGRPTPFDGIETVNDKDGFVANFWRAIAADSDLVAEYATWPVNENDLHARHFWLVQQTQTLTARLEGDPLYFDPKIAGWWVWGICLWIGSGFCSGNGPWRAVTAEDGSRQLAHLGDAGQGVHRKLAHLGDAGQGVHRKLAHLGDAGLQLKAYFESIRLRMERVRVCCGDWSRLLGESITTKHGVTAVFLDPPYSDLASRHDKLYTHDDLSVAHDVREWCIENGENRDLRIALCGYEGEHVMPSSWRAIAWKTKGGYAARNAQNQNATRERIWFSPGCLMPDEDQPMLWSEET